MRYSFLLITLLVAGISNLWGFTPHPPCEKDTLLFSQGPYYSCDTMCYHSKIGVRIFPKYDSFEYAVLARSLGLYLVGIVKDTMVVVTDNRKYFYNNSLQNLTTKELKKRYKSKFKIDIQDRYDRADYAILTNKTDTLIFDRSGEDELFDLLAGSVEGKFCDTDNLQAGVYCANIASELGFVWDDKYPVKHIVIMRAGTEGNTWYTKYEIGHRPFLDKEAFIPLFYDTILLNLDHDSSGKSFVKRIRISWCYRDSLYKDYDFHDADE